MLFSSEKTTLRLLSAHRIIRSEGWSYTKPTKSYYAMSIRLRGEALFRTSEREWRPRAGDILIIPPGVEYSQYTAGEEILAVHFDVPEYREEHIACITVRETAWNEVTDLFSRLFTLCMEQPRGWYYAASALLYETATILSRESSGAERSEADGIDRSAEYLEEHFNDPDLTVSKLAKRSGYSEAHFRRQYHIRFGISPSARIQALRLERAKRLLESGKLTMAETGEKSGMTEAKYFSTWFRKNTGMSPRDYVSSLKG